MTRQWFLLDVKVTNRKSYLASLMQSSVCCTDGWKYLVVAVLSNVPKILRCSVHLTVLCVIYSFVCVHLYLLIFINLARSAKLPEGLYILPMFFPYFYFLFFF